MTIWLKSFYKGLQTKPIRLLALYISGLWLVMLGLTYTVPTIEPLDKEEYKAVIVYRPNNRGGWLSVCSGVVNKQGDLMTAEHCIFENRRPLAKEIAYGEGRPEVIIPTDKLQRLLPDVVYTGKPFMKPIIKGNGDFYTQTYALTDFEVKKPLEIPLRLLKRLTIKDAKDFVYWLDGEGSVLLFHPPLQRGVSGAPVFQKYGNHIRVVGILIGGNKSLTVAVSL